MTLQKLIYKILILFSFFFLEFILSSQVESINWMKFSKISRLIINNLHLFSSTMQRLDNSHFKSLECIFTPQLSNQINLEIKCC